MEQQEPTSGFQSDNYTWPEPGTRRNCPFSGIPLELNEQRPGYIGKPWTCPQCIWYFSEEELQHPENFEGQDCPHTLKQKSENSH